MKKMFSPSRMEIYTNEIRQLPTKGALEIFYRGITSALGVYIIWERVENSLQIEYSLSTHLLLGKWKKATLPTRY